VAGAVPAARAACATLLALGAAAACADTEATWIASAGITHRHLVERADSGRQLVKESGTLALGRLGAQMRLASGGALQVDAEAAGGQLDYEGQTQGGQPLASDTRDSDLALALSWRPLALAAWGEGWLGLRLQQQRRQILATSAAGGLVETSQLVLPGVRWSAAMSAAGWRWQPAAELRASVHHALDVDFGGVFDSTHLQGGRRREFVLGLRAGPLDSPWRFSAEWLRARQSGSPSQDVHRAGVSVGVVRQPQLEIGDFSVQVRREW